MKKIFLTTLFLVSALGFSQNGTTLSSTYESIDAAILIVKSSVSNLSEGFSIEVANSTCASEASPYLATPIRYDFGGSAQNQFVKISDHEYRFTTPFSLIDLESKWFQWRVITASGASEWKCFSWSDYCETRLTADGKCK